MAYWRTTGSKYHAKKTTVDGITFDSKKEARRWQELKMLEKAGVISDLQRQVKYELIPAQRDPETGKVVERACTYYADFVYKEGDKKVIEDTKGVRTAEYKIKRKLVLQKYGIRIRET